MGHPPRSQKPHAAKPSPLQQVHLTRPISQLPATSGLVRDPQFWKRFSTAMHMAGAEVPVDEEKGTRSSRKNSKSSSGSLDKNEGNDWLLQQAKEKRQCRVICVSITLVVSLLIIAAAVIGWYFTKVRKI